MDDMKIFLINLDRQEQDTGSAWFTLPCDIEEMKETIGLSADSERYLISDFSLPFEIAENVDLSTINEVCMSIAGNDFPYEDIRFLQKAWFPTLCKIRLLGRAWLWSNPAVRGNYGYLYGLFR